MCIHKVKQTYLEQLHYVLHSPYNHPGATGYCGRRRVRLCLPRRRSSLVARWVECWTADSGNHSDVGSNPSDGCCDIWCQKCLRRLRTDCTALFLLGISEWTPIACQGGPKSWAKADHDREPRRTTIEGQGGPNTRFEGQGGPRSGV